MNDALYAKLCELAADQKYPVTIPPSTKALAQAVIALGHNDRDEQQAILDALAYALGVGSYRSGD